MTIKHTVRKDGNGGTKKIFLTPVKAIRNHCVECMGFNRREVKNCTSLLCPLFPYRTGHNISRRGIGQNRTKKGQQSNDLKEKIIKGGKKSIKSDIKNETVEVKQEKVIDQNISNNEAIVEESAETEE